MLQYNDIREYLLIFLKPSSPRPNGITSPQGVTNEKGGYVKISCFSKYLWIVLEVSVICFSMLRACSKSCLEQEANRSCENGQDGDDGIL